MGEDTKKAQEPNAVASVLEGAQDGEVINVSGHKQEVERIFDPLSCISLAVASGNVWPALAGSITVAIYNGGPPGMIYEFIAASFFYWFVAASIAELASAVPSAGGVYHWATITGGPRHGKVIGYFAGYWNFAAWLVATASVLQICANILVAMYGVKHPELGQERWMVFVAYLILCWLLAAVVLFANRVTPYLEQFAAFVVIAGLFVTVIVCAAMPHVNGQPYASNAFVWSDWVNVTGYSSNGFAFLLGMLNGAFAVGTPDVTSHLAEEIPRPQYNIPRAMLAQYVIGFISGLLFLIPVLYGIYDLEAIQHSTLLFPLGDIYQQVTGSAAGSIGLLLLVFIPVCCGSIVGCYLTVSRIWWTLAREKATPFSGFFGTIHPRAKVPANAIVLVAILCTILGCIYIGNATAFSAFVSSFVVLTMASYTAAILPHLLSGRKRIQPGPFWMKGAIGYIANTVSCIFMLVFIVIFCFPFAMPVTDVYMNYTCVLLGGATIIATVFYLALRKNYEGPKVIHLESSAAEMTVEGLRARGPTS